MNSILRRLWWFDPGWLFAAIIGVTFLAATLQGASDYRLYGTPKYIDDQHVVLAIVAIAAFVLGRLMAGATGHVPRPAPSAADHTLLVCFWLATGLTIFGYVVWIGMGFKNGFSLSMLADLFRIDDPLAADAVREDYFVSVKGVSTCAQFGVAAVPLGLWLVFHGHRKLIWPVGLVIVMAAVRALVFSERLALIELIVPATIITLRACLLGRPLSRVVQAGLQLAPALSLVVLILVFGGFEYFRSWRHYHNKFDSYAEFTLWRFGGYYTTAHNNSAMAVETQKPFAIPWSTLRQIRLFPGLSNTPFGYENLTGTDPTTEFKQMLVRYGTPELNNEGGLFQPIFDYGTAGYILFWFASGFIAGRLYRCFIAGTLPGLLIYPMIFLAILETPRFLYLSYTRSFPGLVGLLVVVWLAYRAPGRLPAAEPHRLVAGAMP